MADGKLGKWKCRGGFVVGRFGIGLLNCCSKSFGITQANGGSPKDLEGT